MEVTIRELTDLSLVRRACEMTMHGQESKVSLHSMYKAEHSPIRARMFWVELQGIPSFVSTHLVRHKHGVEHFVQSMRDDLYLTPEERVCHLCGGSDQGDTEPCRECGWTGIILELPVVDRNTPVNHGMLVNAQALIQISRKRLCLKSHKKTVAVWTKLRKAIKEIDQDLHDFMVPECVYRNGFCPELRECGPGVAKVCATYRKETK